MASTWANAQTVHLTDGGTAVPCTTLSLNITSETFDVTNTESGGLEEWDFNFKTYEVKGEIPFKLTSPYIPAVGTFITGTFTDGVSTYDGKIGIMSLEIKGGGKGAKLGSFQGKFSGTVTVAAVTP